MSNTKSKGKQTKITLQIKTSSDFIPKRSSLRYWIKIVLRHHGSNSAEINLRVVNWQESADLNLRFREKKAATNVLAFPFEAPPSMHSSLLGDVVICAAVVNEEAKLQHKTEAAHWAHLVIHGCLHLLGYDHITEEEALKMEQLETQLLEDIGYADPYH